MKNRFCFNQFIGMIAILSVPVRLLLSGRGLCQDISATLKNNTFLMATNRPKEAPVYRWWELVYSEMFMRLNIRLVLKYFPHSEGKCLCRDGGW